MSHLLFIERLIIALLIVGLALLLWSLRHLFILVFGAILVAVILQVIAAPLRQRLRLSPRLAMTAAVFILVALFGAAAWIFGAEVGRQADALRAALPQAWPAVEARLDAWGLGGLARDAAAGFDATGIGASLRTVAISVGSGLLDAALVIFGGIYLAARPDLYRTGLIKLVPKAGRGLAAEALDDTGRALKRWLLGRLVSMVAVGLLVWLGLSLIGVPSALTLGLLAGLLEFIAFVGPILSALPALLLAFAAGPEMAFWTLLLFFAVQQFEGYVLEPMIQQRAVDLPPALLLFALVAGGIVFGLVGVILAEPLTVVLYVLVKRLYVREALHTPTRLPGED